MLVVRISDQPDKSVLRTVERINADSSDWVECRMMDLKEGDTFRMYEPSGEPVASGPNKEYTIWTVASKPFLDDYGITAVVADPVMEKKNV